MAKTTKKTAASKTSAKGKAVEAAPARVLGPFEEMERFMEGFFPRGWLRLPRFEWPSLPELPFEGRVPRVDVVDQDDEVVVKAAVPGVDKKDLEVTMTDTSVTIRGSTSHEEKEEKGDYYRHEIASGSFARTVALPTEVDPDKAKSRFKDGILEIRAPKVAKAKRRSIKIE